MPISPRQAEQAFDLLRLGGVAGIGLGAGLAGARAELFDFSRGQCDANALRGQQPCQRGAQAFAGADDEGDLVFRVFQGKNGVILSGAGRR